MWNSRKLDGVRCVIKLKDDEIVTVSRGGKDYDATTKLIREELHDYLINNPDIAFDGEIYVHGVPLQEISGMSRLDTWEDRCEVLEYWVYDLAIPDLKFTERLEILKEMEEYFKDSKRIKIQEHVLTECWLDIQKLHDKWVNEGFEGAVARKPDKFYDFGKKNSNWIKIKL